MHPSLTGSASAIHAEDRSLRNEPSTPPVPSVIPADFVYILGHQDDYTELRYSLRSLSLIPHGQVWIVGAPPPDWVRNVGWIPVTQQPGYSNIWANQRNNIYAATQHPDITESFVLMNDDFIFLRAVWPLPVVDGGALRSHRVWREHPTNYTRYYEWATSHGISDPLYYAEHRPMLMDKTVMASVHESLAHIPAYPVPTAYGNAAGLSSVFGVDPVLRDMWCDGEWQVSTYEATFHVERYGELIRKLHSTPCVYEC